jgi:N-acetylmuramoyl-L-alanine amidase
MASTLLPGQAASYTILLDAGHGGRDRGARAHRPFCEEKRLCLETAKLTKRYLEQLGYRVVMSRTTDTFVPLSKRVELATQAHSDLFVSIHFNASQNTAASGVEVFYHGAPAARVKMKASLALANLVLQGVIRRTQAISRGVKKNNFYVIRESAMPSILIEGGFVTHPGERRNLKEKLYLEKLARGIADGIDTYLKKKKPRRAL